MDVVHVYLDLVNGFMAIEQNGKQVVNFMLHKSRSSSAYRLGIAIDGNGTAEILSLTILA